VQNIKYLGNKEKHTSAGTGYSQAWTEGSRSTKINISRHKKKKKKKTNNHTSLATNNNPRPNIHLLPPQLLRNPKLGFNISIPSKELTSSKIRLKSHLPHQHLYPIAIT
jgi:hypothetical protein